MGELLPIYLTYCRYMLETYYYLLYFCYPESTAHLGVYVAMNRSADQSTPRFRMHIYPGEADEKNSSLEKSIGTSMRKRLESLVDPALNLIAQSAIQCNACFMDSRLNHSFVDLPQPRFIGSRYGSQDQKVVFVMLNPGAGKIDPRNMDLRNQLYRYRKGEA